MKILFVNISIESDWFEAARVILVEGQTSFQSMFRHMFTWIILFISIILVIYVIDKDFSPDVASFIATPLFVIATIFVASRHPALLPSSIDNNTQSMVQKLSELSHQLSNMRSDLDQKNRIITDQVQKITWFELSKTEMENTIYNQKSKISRLEAENQTLHRRASSNTGANIDIHVTEENVESVVQGLKRIIARMHIDATAGMSETERTVAERIFKETWTEVQAVARETNFKRP